MTVKIKPSQCLTFACILALSCGILWTLFSNYVGSVFRGTSWSQREFEVRRDGTPILRVLKPGSAPEEQCWVFLSLEGKRI